jgi:hypothetical protein
MQKMAEGKRTALGLLTMGGCTIKEAAGELGLKIPRIYYWLKHDAEFRAAYEKWKAGPPLDEAVVAQARWVCVDELARRIAKTRSTLSLRELLGLIDRFLKLTKPATEKTDDNDDSELSAEEIQRMWGEIEKETHGPDPKPPDGPQGA